MPRKAPSPPPKAIERQAPQPKVPAVERQAPQPKVPKATAPPAGYQPLRPQGQSLTAPQERLAPPPPPRAKPRPTTRLLRLLPHRVLQRMRHQLRVRKVKLLHFQIIGALQNPLVRPQRVQLEREAKPLLKRRRQALWSLLGRLRVWLRQGFAVNPGTLKRIGLPRPPATKPTKLLEEFCSSITLIRWIASGFLGVRPGVIMLEFAIRASGQLWSRKCSSCS